MKAFTPHQVFFVAMGKDGDDGKHYVAAETKELAEKWIMTYHSGFVFDKEQDLYSAFFNGRTRWARIDAFPFFKTA